MAKQLPGQWICEFCGSQYEEKPHALNCESLGKPKAKFRLGQWGAASYNRQSSGKSSKYWSRGKIIAKKLARLKDGSAHEWQYRIQSSSGHRDEKKRQNVYHKTWVGEEKMQKLMEEYWYSKPKKLTRK